MNSQYHPKRAVWKPKYHDKYSQSKDRSQNEI